MSSESAAPAALPAAPARAAAAAAARRWLPALRYCAGVFAAVRAALLLLAASAWGLAAVPAGGMPDGRVLTLHNGWQNAFAVWPRWDTNWFLQIAESGYSARDGTAAFFPGYPGLVRLAAWPLGGHVLPAAFLVSGGALIAGLAVVYRLTELEFGAGFARRSVVYLALFPTAVFLFSAYSESLFLLAAAGSIYLARTGRWGWAALAGIAATATRSLGVVVVAALAAEAIHQAVTSRRAGAPALARRTAARLGAAVLPLAGIGGYLAFWQLRFGDWSRPFALEKTIWGRQLSLPWVTLWHGLTAAWAQAPAGNAGLPAFDFAVVAAGLALAVWVAVAARPVYGVFTWVTIVAMLSQTLPGRPLDSDPRYLVTIFPLVWGLAALGRRRAAREAIIGVLAASMAVVAWLFLINAGIY